MSSFSFWLEELDRIAGRVTLAGCFGALGGVGTALYRGSHLGRTVALTSLSCALAGTACFTSERITYHSLERILVSTTTDKQPNDQNDTIDDKLTLPSHLAWDGGITPLLLSHMMGGFIGGSIIGALYKRRPVQGALFLTPIMILIGMGEQLLQDVRLEQEYLAKQQPTTTVKDEVSNENKS